MEGFRTWSFWGYCLLVLLVTGFCDCQKSTDAFKCPQQFGYFRDTSDCNKYFICVFGDALHDKCTPGLFFNHDLRMCDWPRNVKDCQSTSSSGSLSGAESEPSGRRIYGTSSTPRPRHNNRPDNAIPSPNAIAPTQGYNNRRYTADSSRNSSAYQQRYTSARPYLYSTGPPASFKPVYYPRGTPRPTPDPKRKAFEEDYYVYEDDSSLEEEPRLMVNQHLRSGNNVYVRPISTDRSRPSTSSYAAPSPRPSYNSGSSSSLRAPPNTRNSVPAVAYSSFNTRGPAVRPSSYPSVQPPRMPENDRSTYTRTAVHRPAAPTHGSNVRSRPSAPPSSNSFPSYQSLDQAQGDSLDAQFGTNPRSISLPDRPYRPLNSFDSSSEMRKAERSQHNQQPKLTSTRYSTPGRPSYKTEESSESYEEYPEYYYDDEDYEDDDDVQNISPVPKVVIRLQKPSPATTRRTTTTTTTTTTTRRPTPPPTTRRAATTRPPKRGLPFGISRPATKSPIRTGPKPLPRLPSRPDPISPTPRPLVTADKCTSRNCLLPDCRCASSDIPGKIPARDVPQIVLITFDDAVNDLNYELYAELFDSRKNPNGCPILGTFYVSHEWTDYGMVQSLYSKGHEMASHSITHSHGEKFSVSHWAKEISGQREILHLYGGVKLEDVRGMRAPFLQVGGNSMFEMLYSTNFTYDSSMPVLDNNPPFFPYTLDYNIGHECMIPPCPTKSFPGLWEVGMVMWNDYRGGRCSMGDACANPDNAEDVYKMLLKNFERHYNSNRAPFGLFYHAAWFTTQHYRKGYMKFIDYINSKDDVYMVTNWQAIQWMRDPTPLSRIKNFEPWHCPKDPDAPPPCHHPRACNLNSKTGSRSLKTCQPCPSTFPWTGRTGFDEVYAI